MNVPEGETVPVRREPSQGVVQSSLELRIRYADRPRQVIPLNRASVEHDVDGVSLRFVAENGRARFRCLSPSARVYKDGEAVESGVLEVGASLEVGSHRVLLWDAGTPIGYLKGYSAPYANEIWPIPPGRHAIGRGGKRQNSVQLDHPTVSREHATIICGDDGYHLLAESATNPVYLRGEAVEPGATRELSHGDLLELGELVFRFHQPERAPASSDDDASIHVRSFAGLAVQIGGVALPDRAWKTQYVKWLFAHLAYSWEKPVGTEALMEELWPDADPKSARNNFNYTLSTLRKTLREAMPESLQATEVVLRSSSTLQLNPDLLDRHDAVALQRLATAPSRGSDAVWEQAAEAAILSYTGPFLPECYLDWADAVRQTLEIQVMDLARTLLARLEQGEAWDRAVSVGTHVLGLDRHAQWACLAVMRAMSRCGRAPEALRLFESNQALWKEELGLEPELELLREEQRIRTLL